MARGCESGEHESNHRELDEGDGYGGEVLVISDQAPAAEQPRERALDDPAPRHDDEAGPTIGSFDDLDPDRVGSRERAGELRPGVGAVGEDEFEPREQASRVLEEAGSGVAILNIGGQHRDPEHQAVGVDEEMALRALDFLRRIEADRIATNPPFSAALTDWLSMMAAEGLASRPAASRLIIRSA